MKWVVYKHTSPNGKVYIGITCKKPEYRWQGGKGYRGNPYFYNAIKKYGWNNFVHEILYSNLEEKQACLMEISLIRYYNSTNSDFGYNILSGGDLKVGTNNPFYGRHHSDDAKARMSKSKKGRPAHNKGIPMSPEQKIKLSESRLGSKNWNYGKKMSDSVKNAISIANKGVPKSEEHKRKLSEALKGKKHSEEQNKKARIWMLEHNPFRGKHHSEETRKRMSESSKGKVKSYKEKGPYMYFIYCDDNDIPINKTTCISFGAKWASVQRAIYKQSNNRFNCVVKYKLKMQTNEN